MFIQLSIEDFSQCKDPNGQTCFKGIQKIKSKLYLPSVEDPTPYIKDFVGQDMTDVTLLPSGNFSEPLDYSTEKYVFVNFEDDVEDETKSEKLSRHDQMIMSFYKEFLLKNDSEIVVVFTGMESTHQKRFVREVFDNAGTDTTTDSTANATTDSPTNSSTTTETPFVDNGIYWFGNEYLMIYCTSMMVKWSENETAVSFYEGFNVTEVKSVADFQRVDDMNTNETYASYETDATNETNTSNETNPNAIHYMVTSPNNTFEFVIVRERGYWWAKDFKLDNETLFSSERISAAEGFSYHCTHAIKLAHPNASVVVTYERLQLQPNFNGVNGTLMKSFGDAYDCVGFVTPVILSGLFVSFILLFILFIGIICLLEIKPLVRFDDPKGKTITVTSDG